MIDKSIFRSEDLQPDEPHPYEHWLEYTDGKVLVLEEIKRLNIKRDYRSITHVGEIGVRSGYGAVTMMRVLDALSYTGWDNWCSIVGKSGKEWSEILLSPYSTKIHTADTQKLESLYDGERSIYDVFHIDGCHQPEAVKHDMTLASEVLRRDGWMIMDDANYDHVKKGIDMWLKLNNDKVLEIITFEHTMRGDLVLRLK